MKYLVFAVLLIGLFSCRSHERKYLNANSPRSKISVNDTKNNTVELRTDDTTIDLEKIIFSNFDLKIKNFQIVYGVNGFNRTDYPDEHINYHNDKFVTITEKADTIVLSVENELDNKLIEIIPQNKSDQFRISYCYYYQIEYEKGGAVYINDTTSYKPIKDSANFFFRMPRFIIPINEIKDRLKITDSVIKKGSGDYGDYEYPAYIVKGKSLVISRTNIGLKIERLKNKTVTEAKFMIFSDFDPD